jgi:hypothetical protein
MTDTEILDRLQAATRNMELPFDLTIGTFWATIGPAVDLRTALTAGLIREEENIAKRVSRKLTSGR